MQQNIAFFISENNISEKIRFFRNIYYNNQYNLKILLNDINFKEISKYKLGEKTIIDFSNNIIKYNSNNKYDIVNKFDIIFIVEKPNMFDFSKILNKTKICFISHGITQIYKNVNSNLFKNVFYHYFKCLSHPNFFYVAICNHVTKILTDLKLPEYNMAKIIKINSLPQLITNDIYFDKNNIYKESIIIFHQKTFTTDIIKNIRSIYPERKIIIKLKHENVLSVSDDYLKKNNIICCSNDIYVSELFSAYFLVFIDGGTTVIESLKFNKKILIHFTQKYNLLQPYPIKFNKLLISYDLNTFNKNLSTVTNDNYFDNEYDKDIKKLMTFLIGQENFSDFNQDFINIIKFLNSNSKNCSNTLNIDEKIKKRVISKLSKNILYKILK